MAVVNFTGFESGDLGDCITVTGAVSVAGEASRPYSGNFGLKLKPPGGYASVRLARPGAAGDGAEAAAVPYSYIRFYWRAVGATTNRSILEVQNKISSTYYRKMTLRLASGKLEIRDKDYLACGTGGTNFSADTWYRIEVLVPPSTEPVQVYINGVYEFSSTGGNFGTPPADAVILGDVVATGTWESHYDDFYWDDAVFPGAGSCKRLVPNANGIYTAWTGDYLNVFDAPPTGDNGIITSNVLNNKETFNFKGYAAGGVSGVINAVRGIVVIRTDTGTITNGILLLWRSGGADYASPAMTITSTYAHRSQVRATDPATGAAWTLSNLDDVQFGVQQNATGAGGMRASAAYVMVDHAIGAAGLVGALVINPDGPGALNLTWSVSSGSVFYEVERSPDGSTGWAKVGQVNHPTPIGFAQRTLAASTTYYYRVRGGNESGFSAWSSVVSGTTLATTQPILAIDEFDDAAIASALSSIPEGLTAWKEADSFIRSIPGYSSTKCLYNNVNSFTTADSEVRAKVRINSWQGLDTRAGVYPLYETGGWVGYAFIFHDSGSLTRSVEILNDGVAHGTHAPYAWEEGKWYWMRARRVGTTVYGRVWEDGVPEPGTWDLTQSVTSKGAGPFHRGLCGGDDVSFDEFAILNVPTTIAKTHTTSILLVPAATATFMHEDQYQQGTWIGYYGQSGRWVHSSGVAAAWPSIVTVAVGGSTADATWAAPAASAVARYPQVPGIPANRVAGTWFTGNTETFTFNLDNFQPYTIALYHLDWDGFGRQHRVDVRDAATLALLDQRFLMTGYVNGVYHAWNVRGRVRVDIALQGAAANATVSALFLDPPRTVVTKTHTTSTFTKLIPTRAHSTGAYLVPKPTATFMHEDRYQQGNWIGYYGKSAYSVHSGPTTTNWPAGVTHIFNGYANVTWLTPAASAVARLPQVPGTPANRVAAAWYTVPNATLNATAAFVFQLDDFQPYAISLYFLDYDTNVRSHRVDVVSYPDYVLLDSRLVSSYNLGAHLVWNVRGKVQFNVVNLYAPGNATTSAVFLDPPRTVATRTHTTGTLLVGPLIGHWKLDEAAAGAVAVDASTLGMNATDTGGTTTAVAGAPGIKFANPAARNFPSGTRLVTAASGAHALTNNFTVAIWAKSASTVEYRGMLAHQTTNPWTDGWGLTQRFGGLVEFTAFTAGAANVDVKSNAVMVAGTWYHIVGLTRAGTRYLYINGARQALTSTVLPGVNATITTLIGGYYTDDPGFAWLGDLDDARIYNVPLTDDQIQSLAGGNEPFAVSVAAKTHLTNASVKGAVAKAHSTGAALIGNLVGYWKLDEPGTDAAAIDSSLLGMNATIANSTGTTAVAGAPGIKFANPAARNFPGLVYLKTAVVPLHGNLIDNFTISIWAKPAAGVLGTYAGLLAHAAYPAADGWGLFQGPTNRVTFSVWNATVGDGSTADASMAMQADVWYHFTGLIRGGTRCLYVNGMRQANPRTILPTPSTYLSTVIGHFYSNVESYKWIGDLDDARIYNVALTDDQIQSLAGGNEPFAVSAASKTHLTSTFRYSTPVKTHTTGSFLTRARAHTTSLYLVPTPIATFMHEDRYQKGTWIGYYGRSGSNVHMSGVAASWPGGVTVTVEGGGTAVINAPGVYADLRYPQVPGVPANRVLAYWLTTPYATLDTTYSFLFQSDTVQTYSFATYHTEDEGPRNHRVDVTDAGTGAILDTRTLASYTGSAYQVWTVRGRVRVTITNKYAAGNAATSALFLDPPRTVTTKVHSTGTVLIGFLVGHWKLDEAGTGTLATDSSPLAEHATDVTGTTVSVAGAPGIKFANPAARNFPVAGNLALDAGVVPTHGRLLDNFTVAIWARPTSLQESGLLSHQTLPFTNGWALVSRLSGTPSFVTQRDVVLQYVDANAPMTVGAWHHVLGVLRGGTKYIYVNGVRQTFSYAVTPNDSSADGTVIGKFYSNSAAAPWRGDLDDARVYRIALTDDQISSLAYGNEPLAVAITVKTHITDVDRKGALTKAHTTGSALIGALIGHWKFDEATTGAAAIDSSLLVANATDTAGTTTQVVGAPGIKFTNPGGRNLPGGTHLATGIVPAHGTLTDNFTLSIWAKPATATVYQGLMAHQTTAPATDGWGLTMTPAGLAEFIVFKAAVAAQIVSNAALTAGTWYHIVGVARAGTRYLYVNGARQASTNVTPSGINTTIATVFGKYYTNSASFVFTGVLDDARIYGTALSDDQIQSLAGGNEPFAVTATAKTHLASTLKYSTPTKVHSTGTVVVGALIGHWKLDEAGTGTLATDSSLLGEHATDTAGTTTSVVGAPGIKFANPAGRSFPGGTALDAGVVPAHGLTDDFTASIWAKCAAAVPSGMLAHLPIQETNGWALVASNKFAFTACNTGGRELIYADLLLQLGTWYHVVGLTRNGVRYIYINGVRQAATSIILSGPSPSMGTVIGRYYSNDTGYTWTGDLDDARIYRIALTDDQISSLAYGNEPFAVAITVRTHLASTLKYGTSARVHSTGSFLRATATMVHSTGSLLLATATRVHSTGTILIGSLVGHWKLDEAGTAAVAIDSSPLAANATDTLGTTTRVAGTPAIPGNPGARNFPSTGVPTLDAGVVPTHGRLLDNFTVAIWAKPNVSLIAMGMLAHQTFPHTNGWGLVTVSDGTPGFMTERAGTGIAYAMANAPMTLGAWHHVLGVVRAGVKYIYINGVKQAGTNALLPFDSSADGTVIGRFYSNSSSTPWRGDLDDARVYRIALTDDQIQSLAYGNEPMAVATGSRTHSTSTVLIGSLVGHWKLDEAGTGTTAIDSAPLAAHAADPTTFSAGSAVVAPIPANPYSRTIGGNSYLDTGVIPAYGRLTDNFTVAIWARLVGALAVRGMLSHLLSPASDASGGWALNLAADGRLAFIADNAGAEQYIYSNAAIQTNTWYHVVGLVRGGTRYLYVNGARQAETSTFLPSDSQAIGTVFGRSHVNTGNMWNGQLDDARIYRTALTDDQIQSLAYGNEPLVAATGTRAHTTGSLLVGALMGHWKLDEAGTGTLALDSSLLASHATDSGGTTTSVAGAPAIAGNPAGRNFPGDTVLTAGVVPGHSLTNDFTLSIWARTAIVGTSGLLTHQAVPYADGWGLVVNGTKLAFLAFNATALAYIHANAVMQADTWYHVVGLVRGGIRYMYINGIRQTETSTFLPGPSPAAGTVVGRFYYNHPSGPWNGVLDDARIYRIALTDDQISTLAAGGDPLATAITVRTHTANALKQGTFTKAHSTGSFLRLTTTARAVDHVLHPSTVALGAVPTGAPPYVLGVAFYSDVPGYVRGVKFFRTRYTALASRKVNLWDPDTGLSLAEADTVEAGHQGWFLAYFATPVPIEATKPYYASAHYPDLSYGVFSGYYSSDTRESGPIHAHHAGAGPAVSISSAPINVFPAFRGIHDYMTGPIFTASLVESHTTGSLLRATPTRAHSTGSALIGPLVGHWKLDEPGTDAAAIDSSLLGMNAVHAGGGSTVAVAGAPGIKFTNPAARSFPSPGTYLKTPVVPLHGNLISNFTLSIWARPAAAMLGSGGGLLVHNAFPLADGWALYQYGAYNRVNFIGYNAGAGMAVYSDANTTMQADVWYHFVGLVKAGIGYMYVNGIKQTTSSAFVPGPSPTLATALGNYYSNASSLKWLGDLDDARIYSTALTDDQIQSLAGGNEPFAVTPTVRTHTTSVLKKSTPAKVHSTGSFLRATTTAKTVDYALHPPPPAPTEIMPAAYSWVLGVAFYSDVPGYVRGVKFFRTRYAVLASRKVSLWDPDTGLSLAEADTVEAGHYGWFHALFATPVPIEAGKTYYASAHYPDATYGYAAGFYDSGTRESGPIHAHHSGAGPGVYRNTPSPTNAFPPTRASHDYMTGPIFTASLVESHSTSTFTKLATVTSRSRSQRIGTRTPAFGD